MCIHTNRKVFKFSVTATMFSSTERKYITDVLSGITIQHLCCYPLLDIEIRSLRLFLGSICSRSWLCLSLTLTADISLGLQSLCFDVCFVHWFPPYMSDRAASLHMYPLPRFCCAALLQYSNFLSYFKLWKYAAAFCPGSFFTFNFFVTHSSTLGCRRFAEPTLSPSPHLVLNCFSDPNAPAKGVFCLCEFSQISC